MSLEQKQDRLVLRHPNGASIDLLLFGATVISWKSPSMRDSDSLERLFLSSKAALDGSRAVRGGIPIVFPCFGAPTLPEHLKLNQHGLARSEVWTWDGVAMNNDTGVSARLTLEPTPKIRALYDKPFRLSYVVTLSGYQLSTELNVQNTSTSDILEFQALFHTYIRAPSNSVNISHLQQKSYYDKTEPTETGRNTAKLETREAVDVKIFTDSVYEDTPQQHKVTWPGGGIAIKSHELKDLVIWNPQQENGSKLSDMEEGGWENFVCVEPGYVRGFAKLEPGKTWTGQQVLSVISEQKRLNPL